jgi:hypothetical protein
MSGKLFFSTMGRMFFFSALFCMSCADSQNILPTDKQLVYEGRVLMTDSCARFEYPGTSVIVRFSGSCISARLRRNAGYYNVSVDGGPFEKLSTYSRGRKGHAASLFVLADSLSSGFHTLELSLANEGLYAHPAFYGFVLPEANSLMSQPMPKTRSIEFIGNSITCSYGVEAPSQYVRFSDSTENFAMGYASITAHRYNAAMMVVARSGIGVYRNYNDVVTGSRVTLPTFYGRTFIGKSPVWDFSRFSPDIVCLNLGTNDISQGLYDLEKFKSAYVAFVKTLRSHYPKARIILLSGCMLRGKRLSALTNTLNSICLQFKMSGDSNIYRFDFTPQTGKLGYGADWHPSAAQQLLMANELSQYIESISDWKPVK